MSQVRRDFEKLGEDSFCGIWCSAARDNLQSLSKRALSAVEELGASLGRYDSTMQCTAIDRCINEISLEHQTLRLSLSSNKKKNVHRHWQRHGAYYSYRAYLSIPEEKWKLSLYLK